ncbi:hypothetical protein TNCV_223451 [Trichonephila clavipes]|nr:hypothetical protein TNCV_223451 [Trichonephila clavipes]
MSCRVVGGRGREGVCANSSSSRNNLDPNKKSGNEKLVFSHRNFVRHPGATPSVGSLDNEHKGDNSLRERNG